MVCLSTGEDVSSCAVIYSRRSWGGGDRPAPWGLSVSDGSLPRDVVSAESLRDDPEPGLT